MQRYRQRAATAKTITKRAYDEKPVEWMRGQGTDRVNDRYKTSKASYPIPERHYPYPTTLKNENWQQPYVEPFTAIAVALQATYGSRYRVAGVANTGNRLVVIQNPTGPIVPTDRGFQVTENNARLGRFLAQMNAASTVRRRRGQ